MIHYTVIQVASMLGIKVHTIRYWEKYLTFLLVKKDEKGKRIYTNQEIYVLYRLQFLIHQKGYTLKGATSALMWEFSSKQGSTLRVEFLSLLDKLDKQRSILEEASILIDSIKQKEKKDI